jgi:hypothetical protein
MDEKEDIAKSLCNLGIAKEETASTVIAFRTSLQWIIVGKFEKCSFCVENIYCKWHCDIRIL